MKETKIKLVLDNIIFWIQKSGGISVVWKELIIRSKNDFDVHYINQTDPTSNIFFINNLNKDKIILENRFFLNRICSVNIELDDKFIFHSSYYRFSNSPNAINVTTVHDFTHQYYIKGIRGFLNYYLKKRCLKKSHGIICISEHTKKDLLRIFPWTESKKIKVIYNGVNDDFFVIDNKSDYIYNLIPNYSNRINYIIFIGSRANYKNFDKAVDTLKILPENFHLLIVGNELNRKEKKMLSKISGRYHCLENINNEKLNILYNISFCLIYPSSYEGFGIPVLESMKAGCPVVTVKNSSLPEVAANSAILVEEICAQSLAKAILSLLCNNVRNELIRKGLERAKQFSWERNYNDVKSFYEELI